MTHKLVRAAMLIYQAQPLEERVAVLKQRRNALRYFQITRDKLAADLKATPDDLETLDALIRFARVKLDEDEARAERRRMKTRERVARWRANRKLDAA